MTEQQLERLIDRARQEGGGDLWGRLCQLSGTDPETLAGLLLASQGVVVLLADAPGPDDKVLRSDEDTVCLQQGGRTLLMVDDPWSMEAVQRLDATAPPGTCLALARKGQRQRWSGSGCPVKTEQNPAKVPERTGSSVVDFVDQAIARAYVDGASDVHFETTRQGLQIKYRLDGVMVAGAVLDGSTLAEEVVSRIKVMGQLDITERRRPQDGRIRWLNAAGDGVDLRVSIMPSIFGEDVVLRLLDKAQLRQEAATISLDLLGFSGALASRVRALASRPHGMLLVTGPTGSGKTTTVYAALSEVNDGLEKIVTIEDPVEYELPGVLQIPVNEQKGLTFATGLRSILRHDPDKILVGEIRDAETAQIAVQSALTGHLVFTTVHANSLLDVLGRFRHFGIEPFALASALNGVVVQRLLRRCCPNCMDWRGLSEQEVSRLAQEALPVPQKVPSPAGCERCRGTGYRGRFVLAEVHALTDAVRDMMLSQDSMTAFKTLLYGDGKQRLAYQSIEVVAEGLTTLEEVRRVVGLG